MVVWACNKDFLNGERRVTTKNKSKQAPCVEVGDLVRQIGVNSLFLCLFLLDWRERIEFFQQIWILSENSFHLHAYSLAGFVHAWLWNRLRLPHYQKLMIGVWRIAFRLSRFALLCHAVWKHLFTLRFNFLGVFAIRFELVLKKSQRTIQHY